MRGVLRLRAFMMPKRACEVIRLSQLDYDEHFPNVRKDLEQMQKK